eukprot:scaffold290217_cov37-Tisochrysis_lutea.AAC.3
MRQDIPLGAFQRRQGAMKLCYEVSDRARENAYGIHYYHSIVIGYLSLPKAKGRLFALFFAL